MADHLVLPEGRSTGSTRRTGGPRDPFSGRRTHARAVARSLDAVDERASDLEQEEEADVLALKLRAATRISLGALKKLAFTGLGEDEDWNYYVLSTREARRDLRNLLSEYANLPDGDDFDWDHPRSWADTLDKIELVEIYGPEDRHGPSLSRLQFDPTAVVECQLWPAESNKAATARLGSVLEALSEHEYGETTVLANDPRPDQLLIKAAVTEDALEMLLSHGNVQSINAPARATVTQMAISTAVLPDEFPEPGHTRIGVIDGIVNVANPLLNAYVLDAEDFPSGWHYPLPDEHGTRVAGVAVWGDLDGLVPPASLGIPHPIVSARVLESDGRGGTVFAGHTALPHQTLIEAVEWLVDQNVKIVNLSVNYVEPASPRRNSFTYTLDQLIRDHELVAVVSSGNFEPELHSHHLLNDYPGYLTTADAAVASPGDASLAVTVGSIARRDVPAAQQLIAVARSSGPSHFTRTPTPRETFTARLKPEFLHHGGNGAWDGGRSAPFANEPGTSVLVTVPGPGPGIVGSDNGTSFAAPAVAHEFAALADRYPAAGSNLLRALMALSSRHVTTQTGLSTEDYAAYGVPETARVLESTSERVILTYEGEAATNATTVHRLPVPDEFADGYLEQSFRVTLAFDPPVRRTRREYIAGRMGVELVRGIDEDQVMATYATQPTVTEMEADLTKVKHALPEGALRPRMTPPRQRIQSNTLVRRDYANGEWNPDHEDYFLVVTHTMNRATPKQRESYETQTYALAVELALEGRSDVDLYALVAARLRARVRVR